MLSTRTQGLTIRTNPRVGTADLVSVTYCTCHDNSTSQGPVVRSMVSANILVKWHQDQWVVMVFNAVSANQASSNSALRYSIETTHARYFAQSTRERLARQTRVGV